MNKKKIAILGKNDIAVNILEILLEDENIDVVLVVPNNSDTGEDSWQRSLKKFANQKNLNVKQFNKIKESIAINYLKQLNLDFIFSLQYDQIINDDVIQTTKYGCINLHFAPLPKYRGVSPIAWALINGEKNFGVTIHYMDPGVDTGDIINQKIFSIENIRNARELYDYCTIQGTLLFKETYKDIIYLKNGRFPQDNSKALYYSKGLIDFKNNMINFNKDTRSLVNWIRAFIFPPFQYPVFKLNGTTYEVIDVAPDYRKNNFEKPGTLIFQDVNFFKFATHDSYINLIVK